MLFSIITPVYNAKNTIGRCVKSVRNQSEQDFEYIIVDDGSTDGSTDGIETLLEGMQSKIVRISNRGVSAARNIGLEQSVGEYVLFLDADDELTMNALEQYRKHIEQYHSPDVLFCGFYKVYPKKTTPFELLHNNRVLTYNTEKQEFSPFISRLIGTVWGKCYKRAILCEERFSESLKLCEDTEFNYRVFAHAKDFLYINKNLYRYYYSMDSTIRKYNADYLQMYVEAVERIRANVKNKQSSRSANEFACIVLNVICFNVVFTKQNQSTLQDKKNVMKNVCENTVFADILGETDTGTLPVRHRLSIFLLKKKMYCFLPVVVKMNALLNKLLY